MAVPKKRISRRRRDLGRTHYKINPVNMTECPECHELKRPHQVCASCGKYNKIEVLKVT